MRGREADAAAEAKLLADERSRKVRAIIACFALQCSHSIVDSCKRLTFIARRDHCRLCAATHGRRAR